MCITIKRAFSKGKRGLSGILCRFCRCALERLTTDQTVWVSITEGVPSSGKCSLGIHYTDHQNPRDESGGYYPENIHFALLREFAHEVLSTYRHYQ